MEIFRNAIAKLVVWKDKKDRNPLLIKGARQIGKTWVMRTFGNNYFKNVIEINFDMNVEVCEIFERTKDPLKIISEIELLVSKKIVPGQTLLIFDEIQASENVFNSLKYFSEIMPDLHIIAAGSLLGVAIKHKNMTVPVGKVEVLQMYPVTFDEFFHSAEPLLWQWLDEHNDVDLLPVPVRQKLYERYKQFLVCGGLPKAALAMLEGNYDDIDDIINNIIALYEADFSKYASATEVIRIGQIWRSLPSQLAKENRKFVYKVVRAGARAREYEDALFWLHDAGLVTMVHCVSKPGMPLSAYKDLRAFKVYALDCGVLRCLSRLPASAILSDGEMLVEMKGAISENYVLQSLLPTMECDPYYWCSDGKAEVDFVTQVGLGVYPIEVKASTNLSGRSLKSYADKYAPSTLVRMAYTDLSFADRLLSVPLPLVFKYKDYLKSVLMNG